MRRQLFFLCDLAVRPRACEPESRQHIWRGGSLPPGYRPPDPPHVPTGMIGPDLALKKVLDRTCMPDSPGKNIGRLLFSRKMSP
jgi:hypothetical protein